MSALSRNLVGILSVVLLSALVTDVGAAVVWDEATNGDLSDNRLVPTTLAVAPGSNNLLAHMVGGDLDYFTINVPVNFELSALVLEDFVGDDFVGFIAVQNGTQMTVPPDTETDAGLLGWTHLDGFSFLGMDLLPFMGASVFEGIGFTPPLPSGDYTFWIQQRDDSDNQVELDFQITAVPGAGLAGDYNGDDVVDGLDYAVWRNNLGDPTEDDIQGNGDGLNGVDEEDFNVWKLHYRDPQSGGGGLAVPEPATALGVVALVPLIIARSRRLY